MDNATPDILDRPAAMNPSSKNGNNNVKYSNIINLPSSYKSKYIVINYKFLYRMS
jgi:hypothetical protein